MSTEAYTIPDDIMQVAGELTNTTIRNYERNRPANIARDAIAQAINDAVMAEREKIVAGIAARLDLDQTCCACPEQYDAKLDGAVVGYLRLRHGRFRVDYPECGEHEIYAAYPNGDGVFDDDERAGYLGSARRALAEAVVHGPFGAPPKAEG